MTKNLIIPVAGKSSRYPGMRPKWLLTMPDGKLMIEKSISLFELKKFSRIIVVALKEHIQKYTSRSSLMKNLKENISKNIELVELSKGTSCQAETVLEAIKKAKIEGGIYIKDCDNMFASNIGSTSKNEVTIVDANTVGLMDAKNKSYIDFNKIGYLTNIVEKEVISSFFCCGGYSFKSALKFVKFSISSLLLRKLLIGSFVSAYPIPIPQNNISSLGIFRNSPIDLYHKAHAS